MKADTYFERQPVFFRLASLQELYPILILRRLQMSLRGVRTSSTSRMMYLDHRRINYPIPIITQMAYKQSRVRDRLHLGKMPASICNAVQPPVGPAQAYAYQPRTQAIIAR